MSKRYYLFSLLSVLLFAACDRGPHVVTQLFPVRMDARYGFIDRGGRMAIDAKFSQAGCFDDGLALVASTDAKPKWGYIDNTGKYVVNALYVDGTSFSEGIAFVVSENGEPEAIDKTGSVIFRTKDVEAVENFRDGLAAFSVLMDEGEQWGFMNKKGETVIQPQYKAAGFFSEGLCAVCDAQGKWGFIDKKGALKIGHKFDNVAPFYAGKAKVMIDGKWGIADNTGKYLVEPAYANIDLDGNRYMVQDGNKFGWLDRAGKVIITPRFEDAFPFNGNKYAAVQEGGKWGYINEAGKFAIDPKFEFAFVFDGDLAAVRVGNKEGFINNEGTVTIQPTFDDFSMDYYLRVVAKTSAFGGIATDKNTPIVVAYKWLSRFYHLNLEEAKELSTEDTKGIIDQFASMGNLMPDSSKLALTRVRVAVKAPKEEGDKASVMYTTSDNPGKTQTIDLVKKEGKWLVQFSKNDVVKDELQGDAADEQQGY